MDVWDGPFRRFGPLQEGDVGLGDRCPRCGEKTLIGQYVTLIAMESPEFTGSMNARAAVAHWECRRKVRED